MIDEKVIDEKVIDEKVIDEKVIDEKMIDEKVIDEKIINKKMTDKKTADKEINGSADIKDTFLDTFLEIKKKGYCSPCPAGAGAHAKVYRVWKPGEKAFYACKVSRERKLWERESFFLSNLDYPLFPAYRESWQEGELCFLVMEYVPGENLGRLLKRRGRISQGQALRIGRSVAEGLVYLEELRNPLLFRDLKPENIRIREDGQIKLLDLGCACFAEYVGSEQAGTPGYAAPEQLTDGGAAGAYSDVYSFGKLMHYMLTGDDPCLPPAIKPKIRTYNRKFSRGLEELVEKCVREDPGERFPDMRSVLRRLEGGRGRTPEFVYEKNVFKTNIKV